MSTSISFLKYGGPTVEYDCLENIKATNFTELMWKCVYLNNFGIMALSERDKKTINAKNSKGFTALMLAARYSKSSKKIFKVLLDAGADINLISDGGSTALIIAVQYCGQEDVELLLKAGADATINTDNNWSALLLAVSRPTTYTEKIVKLLLDAGADVNSAGRYKKTVLMDAAQYAKSFVMEKTLELLLQYGADPNLQDANGDTALIYAIRNSEGHSSERAVELLLQHKANPNLKNEYYCMTALMYAVCQPKPNRDKMIALLLQPQYGTDLNVQGEGSKQQTALMLAVHGFKQKTCTKDIIKLLLKPQYGANINLQDKDGNTVLKYVLHDFNKYDLRDILNLLLTCKPNFNLEDLHDNDTILMYVVRNSKILSEEIVNLFLKAGADPNGGNKYGVTALMRAAQFSNWSSTEYTVELLLKAGANPNLQDCRGWTALMYAKNCSKSSESVKELLVKKSIKFYKKSEALLETKDKEIERLKSENSKLSLLVNASSTLK